MEPREEVDKIYEIYKTRVKPLIEKGEYLEASVITGNLLYSLKQNQTVIIAKVKMSGSYIASLEQLLDRLKGKNKVNIKVAMESFESYYNQTQVTKPNPSLN